MGERVELAIIGGKGGGVVFVSRFEDEEGEVGEGEVFSEGVRYSDGMGAGSAHSSGLGGGRLLIVCSVLRGGSLVVMVGGLFPRLSLIWLLLVSVVS